MADTRWFEEARFGLFLHWGIYAVHAKGEWYASIAKLPPERYASYFEAFDPADYDPRRWARLAKQAGMRYAVLTAKHHDGFCLFDSACTNYKSTNTPAGRDLVREYLEAFRAEGLRVGLYYSLVDWHRPDYPAYADPFHPLRGDPSRKNESCDFGRYLDYLHQQVRELCTNYGKLDLLWFDFSYEGHSGEDWRAEELVRMVRSLQPGILINSRLEASGGSLGSLLTDAPSPWAGDFATPEQIIPPAPLRRPDGTPVCWEACQTMNNSFGYTDADRCFKTAKTCIRQLVNCVSKGGQLSAQCRAGREGQFPPAGRENSGGDRGLDASQPREHLRLRRTAPRPGRLRLPRHRPHDRKRPHGLSACTGAAGRPARPARHRPQKNQKRPFSGNGRGGRGAHQRLGRGKLSRHDLPQPGGAIERDDPPAG